MHLKKTMAVLGASSAIVTAVMGVTGTAQASTSTANPTTATAAPRHNPPLPKFIYGFYSSQELCAVYGGGVVALSIATGGSYRGFFCQDGWGSPTPWALWIYYD